MKKITSLIIFATFFTGAQKNNYITSIISMIQNRYTNPITFHNAVIKPNAQRSVIAEVPFVSYSEHRAAFVFGMPYSPNNAIKISFNDGRIYCIWRDERGFVGAFKSHKDITHDEAVPKKLLNIDESKKLMRLLLLIDARGKISLQHQ